MFSKLSNVSGIELMMFKLKLFSDFLSWEIVITREDRGTNNLGMLYIMSNEMFGSDLV